MHADQETGIHEAHRTTFLQLAQREAAHSRLVHPLPSERHPPTGVTLTVGLSVARVEACGRPGTDTGGPHFLPCGGFACF